MDDQGRFHWSNYNQQPIHWLNYNQQPIFNVHKVRTAAIESRTLSDWATLVQLSQQVYGKYGKSTTAVQFNQNLSRGFIKSHKD